MQDKQPPSCTMNLAQISVFQHFPVVAPFTACFFSSCAPDLSPHPPGCAPNLTLPLKQFSPVVPSEDPGDTLETVWVRNSAGLNHFFPWQMEKNHSPASANAAGSWLCRSPTLHSSGSFFVILFRRLARLARLPALGRWLDGPYLALKAEPAVSIVHPAPFICQGGDESGLAPGKGQLLLLAPLCTPQSCGPPARLRGCDVGRKQARLPDADSALLSAPFLGESFLFPFRSVAPQEWLRVLRTPHLCFL